MGEQHREAMATIALIAALADGYRSSEEVAQLEQIATDIGGGDYDSIARRVLSGKTGIHGVVAALDEDDARRKAYELAVAVVHADGAASPAEKSFLDDLRAALRLDQGAVAEVDQVATALGAAATSPRPDVVTVTVSDSTAAELDNRILDNAILAAALELLPQGLASLAIVPLQIGLVYRIGQDHGQKLDSNQVKDLFGAMGLGAAGQVMEGAARKILGKFARGVFGRALGGVTGGVAGAATGLSLTFATTYALGHAAKQYYGQGRSLSRDDLRGLFGRLKEDANQILPKVEARIRERARTLKLPDVLARLRA
jgi:uncharacterized protein (DUF697 family)/tellurite resistance protein